MKLLEFSQSQRRFLATLHLAGMPISLDLMSVLAPLSAGSLVDLVRRGQDSNLLEFTVDHEVCLSSRVPMDVGRELNRINTPGHAKNLLDRLYAHDSPMPSAPLALLARLNDRAGLRLEAATLQELLAREHLAQGRYEQAVLCYQQALTNLSPCLGTPEADAAFIKVVLDISHTYYRQGTGYPEVPALLKSAEKAAQRLGDKRSQALVSLHVGRFFFLSERLSDALSVLFAGLEQAREMGDEDIRSQTAEFEGLYHYLQGMYNEAAFFFGQAVNSDSSPKTTCGNIFLPANLAYSYALLGQFHRSIGVLDSSLRRSQISSEPALATFYRSILGTVLLMVGRLNEALLHLQKAQKEARFQKNERALFFAQRGLAFYFYMKGQFRTSYDLTVDTIKNATNDQTISRQNTWPWLLAMLFAFERQGFARIPGLDFEAEMHKALQGPNVLLRGVALRIRAQQEALQGCDYRRIRSLLESSRADLERSGNPIEIAKTILEMARVELQDGQPDKARVCVLDAIEMTSGYEHDFVPDDLKSLVCTEQRGRNAVPHEAMFERFIDIIREFLPTPEQDEFFSRIIRATCRFFGAERGGLFCFENQQKRSQPMLRASHNLADIETSSHGFRRNMGMVLTAYRRNQPLFQHPGSSETLSGGRAAILCLPIEIKGRTWGVLYHENTYTTGSFQQLDRTVLSRIIKHLNRCFAQIEGNTATQEQRSGTILFQSDPTPSSEASGEIRASSENMRELLARADQIAATAATVLILGETGVGKELLARRLHFMSRQRSRPFVVVELTSLPESLVESELFGHEKGAFTGADQQKRGRIELANEGTLFLDEIGDIPKSVQVKLLRVLQEGTFTRLGGQRELRSGFRLIAATNRNLSREVMNGRFREDLYYRLNVVPLIVPPLRERGDDIVLLAEHFLRIFSRKYQKKGLGLSKKAQDLIRDYHWPGNVRELRNVMERAVILSTGTDLQLGPLELERRDTIMEPRFSRMPTMAELQRQYIGHVLQKTGGRIGGPGGAAEILGMKRTTLNSRMKQLGLKQKA